MWMKKLVEQALHSHESGKRAVHPEPEKTNEDLPKIFVIGCGGAGCRAIQKIHERQIPGIITVAIDTDNRHLSSVIALHKIPIGDPSFVGNGAGGFPEIGKKAAEESWAEIKTVITSAPYVFIVTGLGGGTGTGAAPEIAQIAREMGALVIVFGFLPFHVEKARERIAEEGVNNFLVNADSIILLDNNKISSYLPSMQIKQVFTVQNFLVAETIAALVDLFTAPPMNRCERAWEGPSPFHKLLGKSGLAVILVGESNQQNTAESVVRECLSSTMLDIDYRSATGSLIHITGGPDLTLRDAEEVATSLTYELDPQADVIWGARVRNDLNGVARVFALMTGVKK
jgi:cell division protein FtsZ